MNSQRRNRQATASLLALATASAASIFPAFSTFGQANVSGLQLSLNHDADQQETSTQLVATNRLRRFFQRRNRSLCETQDRPQQAEDYNVTDSAPIAKDDAVQSTYFSDAYLTKVGSNYVFCPPAVFSKPVAFSKPFTTFAVNRSNYGRMKDMSGKIQNLIRNREGPWTFSSPDSWTFDVCWKRTNPFKDSRQASYHARIPAGGSMITALPPLSPCANVKKRFTPLGLMMSKRIRSTPSATPSSRTSTDNFHYKNEAYQKIAVGLVAMQEDPRQWQVMDFFPHKKSLVFRLAQIVNVDSQGETKKRPVKIVVTYLVGLSNEGAVANAIATKLDFLVPTKTTGKYEVKDMALS